MHKVFILGESSEDILDSSVYKRARDVVDILANQYDNNVQFCFNANTGVNIGTALYCVESKYNYKISVPFQVDLFKELITSDDFENLKFVFKQARSLCIGKHINPVDFQKLSVADIGKMRMDMDKREILDSTFVVSFWEQRKNTDVFELINYCFEHNKLVLNGVGDLSLMGFKDLK